MSAKKEMIEFKPDDYVVYPTHGVGKVVSIEESVIAGSKMELIVISFEDERMTLRVPTFKVKTSGIRHLSSRDDLEKALEVLKGRARVRRAMWSRRAQEYEAKIHSGNLVSIAEVVRDLYKGTAITEQSYSERQLFESAYERLSREIAVVYSIPRTEATNCIETSLLKRQQHDGLSENDNHPDHLDMEEECNKAA